MSYFVNKEQCNQEIEIKVFIDGLWVCVCVCVGGCGCGNKHMFSCLLSVIIHCGKVIYSFHNEEKQYKSNLTAED